MSVYIVLRSCGHTSEEEVEGSKRQRASRIEWLEKTVCRSCYIDQKEAGITNLEVENGLPGLSGSEKQIRWARTIRVAALKELGRTEKWLRENMHRNQDMVQRSFTLIAQLKRRNDAQWWIRNREEDLGSMRWLKEELVKKGGE